MFPEANFPQVADQEAEETNGRTSFLFDFPAGDFVTVDGKLVKTEGLESVKVWIEKVLRTERFKFKIYESSEYGVSLSDLVAGDYPLDFIKVEIEREVRESLLAYPDIQSVHSFAFERIKRTLECSFTVDTKYGQTGGEIRL